MRRAFFVCAVALLLGVMALSFACSDAGQGQNTSSNTAEKDVAEADAGSTDEASATEPIEADLNATLACPTWEVDDLASLQYLFANADGYAYYYIYEDTPADLEFGGADLDAEGTGTFMYFERPDGSRVKVWTQRWRPEMEDMSRFEEMEVDGKTYYYHETVDEETGEFSYSYFQWAEDGMLFLVHPQEPISPEVIRKHASMRKVEFNVGQSHVGLGSDRPLVASTDKIESIISDDPGIKYRAGIRQ